jgi:hypothetical protein
VSTYTAAYHREGRWLVITVPELSSGEVTQCRWPWQIRSTVRDLVSLMTGADPGGVAVRVVPEPPARDRGSQ